MSKDQALAAALPPKGSLLTPSISDRADTPVLDAAFGTSSAERLFAPEAAGMSAGRRRFIAALALCLFLHAAALFLLFYRYSFASPPPPTQEIPVEVVIEPPPPKPPEPKEKPPEIRNTLDLTPGVDTPRAPTQEKADRDAKEDVSHAPKAEPSPGQSPAASSTDNQPSPASAPQPAPETSAKSSIKPPETSNPDAEPIASAEAKPVSAKDNKQTESNTQASNEAKAMAQLFANFPAVPNYQVGAAARPPPISGGRGQNTYLNVLFGMIYSHIPDRLKQTVTARSDGLIIFDLDGGGNVTGQRIVRSSGSPEIDEAAFAAVRAAGPFPMTPNGLPIQLEFDY